MIILGINAYHGDSSACLVADGKLICRVYSHCVKVVLEYNRAIGSTQKED